MLLYMRLNCQYSSLIKEHCSWQSNIFWFFLCFSFFFSFFSFNSIWEDLSNGLTCCFSREGQCVSLWLPEWRDWRLLWVYRGDDHAAYDPISGIKVESGRWKDIKTLNMDAVARHFCIPPERVEHRWVYLCLHTCLSFLSIFMVFSCNCHIT
jgi:hypothetical protein